MAGKHVARDQVSATGQIGPIESVDEPVAPGRDDGAAPPTTTSPRSTEAEGHEGDAPSGRSPVRLALIMGLVSLVALSGLTGWLGWRAHQAVQSADQGRGFLEVGRQGALNLTVFDYADVDTQVQRTLELATGRFYDDFQRRAPSFAEVVKQVKSKSRGTITDAGLESQTPTSANVLVAVTVTAEMAGQPEQQPRRWRMRISVDQTPDGAKVSNVEFVS